MGKIVKGTCLKIFLAWLAYLRNIGQWDWELQKNPLRGKICIATKIAARRVYNG